MSEDTVAAALWHIDQNSSAIRHMELPPVGEGEIKLRSKYSLISLGTELTVARGLMPEDMYPHMAVPYMDGSFSLPIKYGYSLVGEDPETGRNYHLLHPHQSQCIVRKDDLFEVPEEVPLSRATLASNLGTALTGVWDADIKPGNNIVIIGFGMIGSLIARIIQGMPHVSQRVIEIDPSRMALVERLGFTLYNESVDSGPFDIAFHCSATESGLQQAIDITGFEGRIIEMSWYGSRKVTLKLGGSFHMQRKRIISSQVSSIPGKMQATWDFRRRNQEVFELLKNPAFDLHITNTIGLDEAAELFNTWRSQPVIGLGYAIRY